MLLAEWSINLERFFFSTLDAFTIGYLSMEKYVSTVNEVEMAELEDEAFSIPIVNLENLIQDWRETMTFINDFSE